MDKKESVINTIDSVAKNLPKTTNGVDNILSTIIGLFDVALTPLQALIEYKKIKMEDLYESNDSMDFANEIVKKMEDEVKPSNIELTEYEKKQEEEAIISYDELLKVKDKIYNLTEEEENEEFLDELKTFRLDLE